MSPGTARSLRALTVTAVFLSVLPPKAASAQLPAASELIAKYAAATGGSNWKGHKSARMKATMDIPGAGISAAMEVLMIFPNVQYTKVDIPGMGSMTSGFDGDNAWSVNPMTGPRVLAGQELDAMKTDSDPAAQFTRMSPNILSSETVEKTTMNNQECYKVKHTWKSGKLSHDCFSTADGMIVATIQKQQTPMGEIEVTSMVGGYKDFGGGFKRATTMSQEMMGQSQIITITGWEWDNVNASEMVVPPEIQALLPKKP